MSNSINPSEAPLRTREARTRRLRTFVVQVEDRPGVLNRVASLFRRRAYNIDSLTVGRTHEPGISRITIVVEADEDMAGRFEANLYKLVNVLRVEDITDRPSVIRDIALIKVRAPVGNRTELLQLCEVFRARVVDVTADTLIVEITGTADKIDGMVSVLRPYGIVEMVQSGAIAMMRGVGESAEPARPPMHAFETPRETINGD